MSETTTLTLQTLHKLSAGLAEDFCHQLAAAVADCKQRPSLGKREITVRLTIIPHPEDPEDVLITPVTTHKMPARTIEPVRARRTHRGQLLFDFADQE